MSRRSYQNLKKVMNTNPDFNYIITLMEETGEEMNLSDNPFIKQKLLEMNVMRAEQIKKMKKASE